MTSMEPETGVAGLKDNPIETQPTDAAPVAPPVRVGWYTPSAIGTGQIHTINEKDKPQCWTTPMKRHGGPVNNIANFKDLSKGAKARLCRKCFPKQEDL